MSPALTVNDTTSQHDLSTDDTFQTALTALRTWLPNGMINLLRTAPKKRLSAGQSTDD